MINIKKLQVSSRLSPLTFDCKKGEILHVIGPNGSGKSTLLAALAGMIESQGDVMMGEISLRHTSIHALALHRAYLTQNDRPAFNLKVFQYLSLSLPSCVALNNPNVTDALNELTHQLCIEDKLHRSIIQLSGGEWQRVRLAGICLQIWPSLNPYAQLLILDEPAAALDIGQESLLYGVIEQVAKLGIAVIMANHNLNRTLHHANKVLLLDNKEMKGFGSPSEVLSEKCLSEVFNTSIRRAQIEGKPYLLFD